MAHNTQCPHVIQATQTAAIDDRQLMVRLPKASCMASGTSCRQDASVPLLCECGRRDDNHSPAVSFCEGLDAGVQRAAVEVAL
jgi:hypothetical protein